jgi:hypothetical protein
MLSDTRPQPIYVVSHYLHLFISKIKDEARLVGGGTAGAWRQLTTDPNLLPISVKAGPAMGQSQRLKEV